MELVLSESVDGGAMQTIIPTEEPEIENACDKMNLAKTTADGHDASTVAPVESLVVEEANVKLFVGSGKNKSRNNGKNEDCQINSNSSKIQPVWGGGGFYNPKMGLYRDIVILIIMSTAREMDKRDAFNQESKEPFRFLDAFSGCGALALRVAKLLENLVVENNSFIGATVTANDVSQTCRQLIRRNAKHNGLMCKNKTKREGIHNYEEAAKTSEVVSSPRICVDVTGKDANLLMYEVANGVNDRVDSSEHSDTSDNCDVETRSYALPKQDYKPFQHIHLDPFGCTVPFLDSAINSLKMGTGILTLTATDTGALFDRRHAAVAKRHYNLVNLNGERGLCFREVGLRMVIGAVAQAANRQDKGIDVLLSFSAEHFLFVCVKIKWDTKNSTCDSLRMANLPKGKFDNDQISNNDISQLEGPFWMGKLGKSSFVEILSKRIGDSWPAENIFVSSRKYICKLLETLKSEYEFSGAAPWFYSLPQIASALGAPNVPSKKIVIQNINEKVFNVAMQKEKHDMPMSIIEVKGVTKGSEDYENQDKIFNCYVARASPTHFDAKSIKVESVLLNGQMKNPDDAAQVFGSHQLNWRLVKHVIENFLKKS